MSLFKLGKTRVPHRKNTSAMPPVRIDAPEIVILPVAQHIGAPANPVVKAGDTVYVGTVVAEAQGFVSAPLHSSVSGKVKKIEPYLNSNGKTSPAIIIESDGLMTPDPALAPPVVNSFADLAAAARSCGLIGLGGAGFPTSVKLSPKDLGAIDTLVLNGAECEPYITSDTRTMLDDAEYIRRGVELIMSFTEIKSCVIGIEKNKPECVARLKDEFANNSGVRIEVLPSTYPQGAEKVLIYNSLGRVVPEGALPSDVGVIVMNVTTIAYLAKYVETGMPLVEKCITVDGSAINEPKNMIVPVGTPIAKVIEAAGGIKGELGKVVYGGPMMGVAVYDLNAPILKNTNAIVALNKRDAKMVKPNPCIHCGRCVMACPMGLNPTEYARAFNIDNKTERAERFAINKVNLCIECGSCSFVCPSNRPLVENNKLAKAELREYLAAEAARKV